MIAHYAVTTGIRVLSVIFQINPFFYQNMSKNDKINSEFFKATKDPKIILKIALMLLP